MEMSEHLFRHESGKLVAALTRIFGVHNLALAEDVVQDAFCRALEVWKVRGIPDNPAAWLMAVAKHRALDIVRKEHTARTFAPDLARVLASEWTLAPAIDEAFTGSTIRDEQLRMMFSCCDPALADDVQVALVLNVLCGFGAPEVAGAFLTSRSAMEKRLSRGKKVLARSERLFDLSDAEFASRLSAVLRALYLLFNEGYHGASADAAVRADLCHEAIRLATLLLESPQTATAETEALLALMHLQAAKLSARLDAAGDLNPLGDQDRSCWDRGMVQKGLAILDRSAHGAVVSSYHLEAAIAAVHATAGSMEATNWSAVVDLYDRLMTIAPSPIVALNRAIAVGQRDGPQRGLECLRLIDDVDRLRAYPFYPAAIGELELRCGNVDAARRHLSAAAKLARNDTERRFLDKRIRELATCSPSSHV
jgi:RNA polymerase sigma-70 factor (ECF subfamily)